MKGRPPFLLVAAILGAVSASRFLAIAAFPGEIDEAVFAGAVLRFDLFDLSPQAPGFPLWILLGRLVMKVVPSPFDALAVAATLLSALALPALYVWGRRAVGEWAALSGVLLSAALPVVWVNGGRAFSDSPSTALFLLSLAALTVAEGREPGRGRALAVVAGLLAAAGAGVRPHLVAVFGPLLLLETVRLSRRRAAGRTAAGYFVLAGLAGTAAWLAWLVAQAGGPSGFVASLHERAAFRSHAFATGAFGTLLDSFLVRDLLSWKRALAFFAFAAIGLGVVLAGRSEAGEAGPEGSSRRLDVALVVACSFLSLWFLHSRAMSRYSVPFVHATALLFGAGLVAVARRGPIALAVSSLCAAAYARETYPEVRWGATHETPVMSALLRLERYVHSGRETIVADDVFHAFLRLERWDRRLVAWGYLDSELVSGERQMNRRLVRLADLTAEEDPAARHDPAWRTWYRGGRVNEMLGNGRLLNVGLRDPGPPLFGPGFGVVEHVKGRPSFRWAGTSAKLYVPGLQGPPAVRLAGERPAEVGAADLTVVDALTSHVLLTRRVPPGPFELVVVPEPVYGPLPRPVELLLRCERPKPLPPLEGATRPREGCFVFEEATYSRAPEAIWAREGGASTLDVGSPDDAWASPLGFHGRERIEGPPALDFRWTAEESTVTLVVPPGFVPGRLVLRARAPFAEPVDVLVLVDGESVGTVRVPPGPFSDVALELPGGLPPGKSRLSLRSATISPEERGAGADARRLGIAVDRMTVAPR